MNNALGAEFINKLYGDMQLTLSRDHRQLVDWLAAGKGMVCVPCDDAELARRREQWKPKEQNLNFGVAGKYAKLVGSAAQGAVCF